MPCRKAGLFLYVFSKKCRRYKSETAYTAYAAPKFTVTRLCTPYSLRGSG